MPLSFATVERVASRSARRRFDRYPRVSSSTEEAEACSSRGTRPGTPAWHPS